MPLIDCHTHAFSGKIAARAVEQLIQYYQLPTPFGGELRDLLVQANLARLDALILLVAATKPEQVHPAHEWILGLTRWGQVGMAARCGLPAIPRVVPFGTFHPDDTNWLAEITRLRAAGIRGIKLHPEFQGIDLADRRLWPLFEAIAGDFILMVHVGDPRVTSDNASTPAKVAAILRDFPTLDVIAAHLGGYRMWDEVLEHLAGRSLYLDTSSALAYIDPALLRRIVDRHGVERILFGSDYPLRSPQQELDTLATIDWLSEAHKAAIRGDNCATLLARYGIAG